MAGTLIPEGVDLVEDGDDLEQSLDQLDKDLSKLGEILADRILLEDQIISAFTNQ